MAAAVAAVAAAATATSTPTSTPTPTSEVSAPRSQVVIVGAGPAGLLPFHPPHLPGIGSVVLENRDRPYTQSLRTERRQRAGRLEQGTADVLR
ncbi:MAG TPA: FAD-dependent monooxygenase, partial [Actinomadura sp.]|nr:FAD-dependent monooxygenase [Actinomadura sp.]